MTTRLTTTPFPIVLQPTVLQDGWELRGPLDLVEPYGDGLIHVRVAGLDKLVSDKLKNKLSPLVGHSLVGHMVSILRIDDRWGCAEVSGND